MAKPRMWERDRERILLLARQVHSAMLSPGSWHFGDSRLETAWSELIAAARLPVSMSELMRAFKALPMGVEFSLEALEAAQQQVHNADRKMRNIASTTWQIVLPIPDLTCSVNNPSFRCGGLEFRFLPTISFPEVQATIQDPKKRFLLNISDDRIPRHCIVVEARGHDPYSAWESVSPSFEILRGMLEFSLSYGQQTISFGNQGKRSRLAHPRLFIAKSSAANRTEAIRFIGANQAKTNKSTIDDRVMRVMTEVLLPLSHTEPAADSIASVALDCLRLYAQALDADYDHLALLGLWQVAERISLAEQHNGRTEHVVSCLLWFASLNMFNQVAPSEALGRIARIRNRIVHHGLGHTEEHIVHDLKLVVDVALKWLIRNWRKIESEGNLAQIFQFLLRDIEAEKRGWQLLEDTLELDPLGLHRSPRRAQTKHLRRAHRSSLREDP